MEKTKLQWHPAFGAALRITLQDEMQYLEMHEEHRKSKDYTAVMNLITRANWEQMEVEKMMCDALNELFAEELKEADSRGRTEGLRQGKREMIFAFLKAGVDIKTIKEASGLNEEEIESIRREME